MYERYKGQEVEHSMLWVQSRLSLLICVFPSWHLSPVVFIPHSLRYRPQVLIVCSTSKASPCTWERGVNVWYVCLRLPTVAASGAAWESCRRKVRILTSFAFYVTRPWPSPDNIRTDWGAVVCGVACVPPPRQHTAVILPFPLDLFPAPVVLWRHSYTVDPLTG